MRELKEGDWYGRVLQRVELDPQLLPTASSYWTHEWYPPKTVEARELIWLRQLPPTYDDLMDGVDWYMRHFAARPTAVYCDAMLNPRRYMGMNIYGPVLYGPDRDPIPF